MAATPAIGRIVRLRCSGLPLAFTCPGALRGSELRIDPHNDAADTGTATHEALQPLVEGRGLPWSRLSEIAAKHGVKEDELRALCGVAQKLWNDVRASFPGALSEASVSAEIAPGLILEGHLDGASFAPNAARGLDWKGGRKDRSYAQQLRGYCALLLKHATTVDEATLTALWIRTREAENYTMTRDELARWEGELRERVIEWDGVYHPGDHCTYCPRFHECQASREYLRSAVAVLADRDELGRIECEVESFTPDQLIQLKKKCATVSAYVERTEAAIRKHVHLNGDVVGTEERITLETANERDIDPTLAWPILEGLGFKDDDFAKVMTMSAAKIEKVISARAPRGEKGTAIKAAGELLERSGALTKYETKRLTIRRI